ncbi:receptor-like serine/threonine-protein kinase SD1-8 isoform X1 [Musa acuminata AAA Group]|uniref:receptor-like serine/threonine-protein kinase SD1-8 isoform X1 n=1 Tax=Musa acuminata AAA Group TaxID=214697 RepID=UPI0031D26DE0
MRRLSGAAFLLYLLIALLDPSNGADTLTLDHPLADGGEPLISEGGSFALGFFSPNGSDTRYIGIWYEKISVQTVVWVANRRRPVIGSHGSLSVAANGTLVITGENSTVVWSSPSLALSNPVAQLLDDGNFVVREADGNPSDPNSFAWQSFDYPTDTLLPGMKLGWNLTTGFNRTLTSWASASDPAPGEYTFGIDLRGDPQIFEWSGTRQVWRAGPWNGLRFTGVPQMTSYNMLSLQFFVDATQVVYVFYMIDPSFVSRLVVNQSGTLQRLVWVNDSKFWNAFWYAPMDACDTIFPCGPNAVCDTSRSPQCGCPQGFQPKNPTNWGFRDGSDGCVRKTEVDCRNGTDGFVLVSGAKLPDTSSSTVEWVGTTLDQCRAKCLKNCSCTAYAQANISGSGSGCILWSTNLTDLRVYGNGGQDLYVRAAAADLDSESSHHRIYLIVITVILALFILILALVGCRVWRRKKRSSRTGVSGMATSFAERHNDEGTEAKDLDLPLFDLGTVADATGNFSMENKLGEGGFGPVYKGKLEDEQDIAVKRLSKTSVQGVDEFKNEVVLIAKLQHRNLVRLLGCCIEGEERMLIYEYMPNGSLDSFVFDKAKGWLLNWPTRYSIIVGIARGLLYLHQDSRLRIIHRDLKASNILLDMHMNPKISDFGMARIFGGDETEVNTKRVVGTYGYMSPEYAMDGIFSVKSDVFSFGVLVLEIISGKKNRGIYDSSRNLNLLGYTWSLWREGKGLDLVDEAIGDSYPKAEVLRCMKVGLLCVQERPEDRPTMSSVLFMLGSDSALLPQPRQPGFVAMRGPLEPDSSTSKQDSLSINNVSVTMFEGR